MSLLHAVNGVYDVFHGDFDKGEISSRAAEIADGNWTADAVEHTMDAVTRATSWMIVASEVAAATVGGSR